MTMQSTRRNFLKIGSLVAAPLAAATVPAMAQAGDDAADRLARLEDANAIRALVAAWIGAVNAGRAEDARALFADPAAAARAGNDVRFIAAGPEAPAVELADDRRAARLSAACTVRTETPITPSCPLVEMARLQGEGVVRAEAARMLAAEMVRTEAGWKIAQAAFTAA